MLIFPNKIREHLSDFGLKTEYPYEIKPTGTAFISFSIYILYQNINAVINRWNTVTSRFLAIEHVFITSGMTIILIEYAFKPNYIHTLLNIAEDKYLEYDFFSEEQKVIIAETTNDINSGTKLIHNVSFVQVITMILSPVTILICKILFFDKDQNNKITIEDFPTPLSYGDSYRHVLIYITIYIMHSIYLLYSIKFAYCIFNSCIFAIQCVTLDEKILSMALYNFNRLYKRHQYRFGLENLNNDIRFIKINSVIRKLIKHHQNIYRKAKMLNNSIKNAASVVKSALLFLLVFCLYTIIKVNDPFLTVKYLIQSGFCIIVLFIYSNNGQKLINEADNIRQAICEFSWEDKPQWFKKTLLVMLTRTNSELEVKPYGLYVINFRNFAMLMNAAYSYYNVFSTLS